MHVELEQIEGRRFAIRARGNEVTVDDTLEAGGPGAVGRAPDAHGAVVVA